MERPLPDRRGTDPECPLLLLDDVFFRNGFWVLLTPGCYQRDTRLFSPCSKSSPTIISSVFLPDLGLLAGETPRRNGAHSSRARMRGVYARRQAGHRAISGRYRWHYSSDSWLLASPEMQHHLARYGLIVFAGRRELPLARGAQRCKGRQTVALRQCQRAGHVARIVDEDLHVH